MAEAGEAPALDPVSQARTTPEGPGSPAEDALRNGTSDGPKQEVSPEPAFPLLQNNASSETLSQAVPQPKGADDNGEEPAIAQPFLRTSRPDMASRETSPPDDDRTKPDDVYTMSRFTLYETSGQYYIVGGDATEKRYRVLKIDRDSQDGELSIHDDKVVYTQKEMNVLLDTIDDGNKNKGGIKQRCTTWGLLGFIKFTGPYYMLLITKKSIVAMIGGHYVYQVDGTELIPLTPGKYKPSAANPEESRFLGILNNLDLTRSFYFSYSYDITRTLQFNITQERLANAEGLLREPFDNINSMFVWNTHLLQPTEGILQHPFDWCRPIVHGHIDQAALSIYGRVAYITLIARRSRFYAGARFLKRGTNDLGYVANDVETEQIVSDSLTTSFHAPGPKLYASPQFTSYVQHRGSIPLYWSQDSTGVTPKPPIELNLIDPFYTPAALHFDNLFERYGSPVYVLNLIKAKERQPRESKLLDEYTKAIDYLNQFLPEEHKIIHKAWDMSRAAKSKTGNVIDTLESIAETVITTTGFFQNGDGDITPSMVQNGVARTNCIDCLDRTNAAQFILGKRALGHQLHALGVLQETYIEYDTDAVNMLTHMYHDHGDSIAVQYGGSQLVNTMETYRRINQWTSNSRDMIESFKRYYNNSFLDSQRQEAYNLFLGNYIFAQGQPMLWDLSTDYYLHHADPRAWSQKAQHNYVKWFNAANLEKRVLPPYVPPPPGLNDKPVSYFDDYWLEYYRPATLSSFQKMFPYKMNSTIRYIPVKQAEQGKYDLSPFKVRVEGDHEVHERKKAAAAAKKGVVIVDPSKPTPIPEEDNESTQQGSSSRGISLQRWLQPHHDDNKSSGAPHGIMKSVSEQQQHNDPLSASADGSKHKRTPQEKTRAAQGTFTKLIHESLNPSVSLQETDDYARYVRHPETLPLVISSDAPPDVDSTEYQEYLNSGSWQTDGGGLLGVTTTISTTGAGNTTIPTTAVGAGAGTVATSEDDLAAYWEQLRVAENPLTVTDDDFTKKRYKAYRKWLRGKSLFKQQPVD
ncbi:SacI homology domain-containing protein [Microdochium trichocladiopsis]|uniref:SacI homology domain-containing protein n=1 Tax=Microdochium trichocladiopsis TaxID=1682393 RepID=A0A9P8Y9U0_9PEZI|nr:SacI homology domain-containing protein [Microdochium trichocladiopsis]KAH7035689.1 SacI homology domain-containing protein [Microdochium trichocladiopsis]